MKIKKKESEGLKISVDIDKKNFDNYIKDLKRLGKKYETQSDGDKLNYSIISICQRLPYMNVKGWCSRVVDKNHKVTEVLFIDYDNILYRIVQDELQYLMEEYNLSPFYIFTSEEETDEYGELYGNYMAICLTKNTYKKIVEMQNQLHCDAAYKSVPLIYRFKTWVLRLGNKGKKSGPEFKEVIGDLKKEYKQDVSQAHLTALQKIYPQIPSIKYKNLDGNLKLFLTEYKTASK